MRTLQCKQDSKERSCKHPYGLLAMFLMEAIMNEDYRTQHC